MNKEVLVGSLWEDRVVTAPPARSRGACAGGLARVLCACVLATCGPLRQRSGDPRR